MDAANEQEPAARLPVRERIQHIRDHLRRADHGRVGAVALLGHISYYLLVSVESGHYYGYAAAFVGVMVVVEAFIGDDKGGA